MVAERNRGTDWLTRFPEKVMLEFYLTTGIGQRMMKGIQHKGDFKFKNTERCKSNHPNILFFTYQVSKDSKI